MEKYPILMHVCKISEYRCIVQYKQRHSPGALETTPVKDVNGNLTIGVAE